MRYQILVVDDSARGVGGLALKVKNAGYEVMSACTESEALRAAQRHLPDMVLLNLVRRVEEMCALLRRNMAAKEIPILVLKSPGEMDDVQLGRDIHLLDRCRIEEVLDRMVELLDRRFPKPVKEVVLRAAGVEIDVSRREVKVSGRMIGLTRTEFDLLTLLMQADGRVTDRETLLRIVWHYSNFAKTRTVDTHVQRLREKLGSTGRRIETVWGVGYRFRAE